MNLPITLVSAPLSLTNYFPFFLILIKKIDIKTLTYAFNIEIDVPLTLQNT